MIEQENSDEFFMQIALKEARKAFDCGEIPVGAVAVIHGEVVAIAHNQTEFLQDATAHAEVLLIRDVEKKLQNWRLENVTIYVTKEPCAMCAGAMVNARVKKVVFGLHDERCGCCGSALDVTGFSGMLHNVEVISGVLENESLSLIQSFFQLRRAEKKRG